MAHLAVLGWNLLVLGGAAYLITRHDWSPWLLLLALLLLESFPEGCK